MSLAASDHVWLSSPPYISPSLFSLSFPPLLPHTIHLLSPAPHHLLLFHPGKHTPRTNSNQSSPQFPAHRSTSPPMNPQQNTRSSTHILCRMDFGLTSGNFIILPEPPSNITWNTEEEVLFYLSWTDEARANLLKQADKIRFSSRSDVWVHHKLFLVPFLIPPKMTDEALLSILTKYLVPRLLHPRPNFDFSHPGFTFSPPPSHSPKNKTILATSSE